MVSGWNTRCKFQEDVDKLKKSNNWKKGNFEKEWKEPLEKEIY